MFLGNQVKAAEHAGFQDPSVQEKLGQSPNTYNLQPWNMGKPFF
jgi:hypothetical protein